MLAPVYIQKSFNLVELLLFRVVGWAGEFMPPVENIMVSLISRAA
ncbi:hypothetical protein BTN49_2285 (plasmid) [Candidatus Enterovibrio escicola]|uniref:Uncharacterized protein n=1 Tax=Candidatus Enterovibrio escicola TaxID=1927127 RepID=A0A2A5T1Q7_9GAMM|nr:hypothetical protein BTN49_2285 [Candidatus Enterovibrio escacola]